MNDRIHTIAAAALGLALTGCPSPEVPEDIFGDLGEVAPYATEEQRATFDRGLDVMARQWTIEDGLGPHFNLSSCGGCHERPVPGGGGPRYRNFLLVHDEDDSPVGPGGGVQQQFHVDRSRHPTHEGTSTVALRNAIPFFGVGLIAELPGEAIEAHADPDDADGDGISGRVNRDQGFVGRFGRKSQTVSVEGFIRGPLFNHLGITSNPLPPELKAALPVPSALPGTVGGTREGLIEADGDVGVVRMHQAAAPDSPITDDDAAPDPEISEEDLFDLVSMSMLLAAPEPDPPTPESEAGHALFDEIGCADCHRESLEGPRGSIPLYSDLLLHDMGEEMADGVRMGLAEGSEFRTQPLWGVAAVQPYLHDGRADTLDEAIRWHGGEAQRAREAYEALSDADRALVITFLESLGGLDQRSPGLLPPDAPVDDPGTYGGPRTDMAEADMPRFEQGRAIFDEDFRLSAGLGPTFNGDSCRACHFQPVIGGSGPIDVNVTRQAILMGGEAVVPEMGTMAHRQGVHAMRPPIDDASDVFELRQTPAIFGLGLVDEIPEAEILAHEDPEDADGDGISGRAHVLPDGRVGRLGWKANVPSLAEFSRDGMSNELGVTVPDQPGMTFGNATDDDAIPDPEITVEELEALTFYMAQLAPPPRTRTDEALEDQGEVLFADVGCTGCHMSLALEDGTPVPLFSDLLLHDVMPEGAHGVPDGPATDREMRTAPLWGLAETAPYMHDGRSGTIEDAIARHHGEASASAEAYAALSAEEREALLAFLRSL
ncbi:MAG TPA: di-heme oxidoredictase family protein [Sandaracinaceae bacterium LLY-WYZ-13_1]|nr:di-heme oxidoredictase family protein [Sandaracinaceae bacterium LLY-WYZ-13_1]